VATSQSFQPGASNPGRHQQISEPITALAANTLEKVSTAWASRKDPQTTPTPKAPRTWPHTKGWIRRICLDRHDTTTRGRRGAGIGADRRTQRLQRSTLLVDWCAQDGVLDASKLLEWRRGKRTPYPTRRARPACCIDLETHPAGIAKETGRRDV